MFLEEVGCRGVRKKKRLGLPLVPSTSDLLEDGIEPICRVNGFMQHCVSGVLEAQKFQAFPTLALGRMKEIALL